MIKEKHGLPVYIEVKNLKVERQFGDGFNENVPPKIIPITQNLLNLLYKMGYTENKERDEYLLSPNRSRTSTYAIMENLSKGFSHFYKLLNTGRNLQFRCLRKTYLTYLNIVLQQNAKYLSSHASDKVLRKYYIDEKIISKAIQNFQIFND